MIARRICRRHRHDDDEGGALIAVVMFGLLSTMVALSLVGRVVVEGREVANSLAQVRAYWAAMGLDAYVLSRTAQSGWCSSPCNGATVASNVQAYVNELSDLTTWRYLDVNTNYTFSLSPSVTAPAAGQLQIRTTFGWTGAVPAVTTMRTTRPLELRYGPRNGTGWGSGSAGNGATMSITGVSRPSS